MYYCDSDFRHGLDNIIGIVIQRLGHSGRKSPSKRGISPSKLRESSPTKKGGRQPSKQKKEEKSTALISPMKATSSLIEEWAKNGLVAKLEAAVLQGHSDLLSNIGKVWNEESRNFIKRVPDIKVLLTK